MKKAEFIAFAFLAIAVPVMAATTLDRMSCHGSTGAKYPVLGAKLGYEVSGHATLGDARYSNATGCQRCHTNEGYVEYVAKFGFSDPVKYDRWANSLNADGTPMVDLAVRVEEWKNQQKVGSRLEKAGDKLGPFNLVSVSEREVTGLNAVNDPGSLPVLLALLIGLSGFVLTAVQKKKGDSI